MSYHQPAAAALLFLVPLFPVCLFYARRGRTCIRPFSTYFIATSLSLLAVVNGSLGLALSAHDSSPLSTAYLIFAVLLRFDLSASLLHLFNVTAPSAFLPSVNLFLYNIVLASLFLCATVSSLLAPLLPRSIPLLLPLILNLVSNIISIPILCFLLAFYSAHANPPQLAPSPPPSPQREKIFQSTRDEPLTVYLRSIANADPETSTDEEKNNSKRICALLLSAQVSAVIFSAFRFTLHILSTRVPQENDEEMRSTLTILGVFQSLFMVVWIICIIQAFFVYSLTPPTLPASPPFTPRPTRLLRYDHTPGDVCYPAHASTARQLFHTHYTHPMAMQPSTPRPSQVTEDFMTLRDPFASPNAGVVSVWDANGARVSVVPELPPLRKQITSGSPMTSHKSRSRLSPTQPHRSKSSPTYSNQPNHRKTTTTRRPKKKGSAQTLIAPSLASFASFPFSDSQESDSIRPASHTLASTSAIGSSPEDVDFDVEEAFLTQLLLMNLSQAQDQIDQSTSHTQLHRQPTTTPSISVETDNEAVALSPEKQSATTSTYRYTQGSTSSERTLCVSEVFKLS